MEHRNPLCRRLLALLLCAALLAGALPGAALAATPDEAAPSPESKYSEAIKELLEWPETVSVTVCITRKPLAQDRIDSMLLEEYGELTDPLEYYNAMLEVLRREYAADALAFCERHGLSKTDVTSFHYSTNLFASLTQAQIRAVAADDSVTAIRSSSESKLSDFFEAGEKAPEKDFPENYASGLTHELVKKLREDFYATFDKPSFSLEDVYIERDCGEYDGCRIVVMGVRGLPMTDDMLYLNVGGYVFTFSSGGYRNLFLTYRNGVFTPVAEAFEKGLLSRQSVRALFDRFARRYVNFTDVDRRAWYYQAVSDAYVCRLFKGYNLRRFDPEGTMTRAMLVTVLWRMNGEPYVEGPSPFIDVPEVPNGTWYTRAVIWAAKNKIVEGVGEGRFAPDSPVTREQFVTLLHRLSGKPEPAQAVDESKFEDAAKVSAWAQDALRWAVDAGVVTGSAQADGTLLLNPAAHATRAQAAALLMRYIDSLPDHFPAAEPDPDPDPDPDPRPGTKNLMEGYSSKLDVSPAPITDTAADAMADFTLDLFRASEKPGESTVMSPASVLCALAMLANGAEGETRAQLEQAFGMDVDALNEALRSYISNLPDKYGETETNLANSVWVRDGFRVKSQFLQDNADYLSAGVFQAPFDSSTVDDINNWISENTDGMIPRLINELSPETVLALVNALYLKAKWHDPYDGTKEMPFYRADGTAQKADMLCSREHTYLHDENAAGFIKNFSSGKYAFAVVVPNEGVDLDGYIAGLSGKSLRKLLSGEYYDAVYAKMPKFKQETFVDLKQPLQDMGIRDAFDPLRADLSGIAPDLVVSQAKHKAVIDVNEKGVSAAAATIITSEATSAGPSENPKIAYVTADRPYLYMIIDRTTNLPLFIGTTTRTDGETITNPIPDPEPVEPTPEPMRTVDLTEGYTCQVAEAPGAISDEAADAMADFTLNMLRAAGDPEANTVLSPLSALYALDMLGNGAKGDTLEQLEQTFGLPVRELNKTLRSVTANLPERYGSTNVHLANSIWVHTGFEVEPQFLQDNADYLDAGAFQAPFDDQTLRDINAWISEQTEGMIPEMLDELSPDTMVALINALYFCGQWAEPYQTVTCEPFYPAGGGVQTVEMMHSTERIYLKDEQAQGFLKTFNSDKYAFAVVVPDKGVSLDEYVAGLDGQRLRRLLQGKSVGEVKAAMPKFSAETFADLNEPLQAMGIRDAFIPGVADLSGIAGGLYVSKSLQKAVIDVDEKGVSAAAATVITLEKNASPSHATVTVTADRPYLFMIIDRTTNLPLFIGYNRTME